MGRTGLEVVRCRDGLRHGGGVFLGGLGVAGGVGGEDAQGDDGSGGQGGEGGFAGGDLDDLRAQSVAVV